MTTAIITNNSTGGTFSGTEDTRIAGGDPTGNYGADPTVDLDSGSDVLLSFSGLANITGPVTVTGGTLSIYITNSPGADTWTLYRILQAWTELGVTWNTKNGAAAWNTAGCNGSGTDRAASNSFSASTGSGTGYIDITLTAGMIADVQGWINGTFTNAGWKVSVPTNAYIVSTKNGTDAQRPKLSVDYTASGSTYTLTAGQGSYALTGQTVNFLVNRVVVAAQGSYALTGQTAALSYNTASVLTAGQGSYLLTGSNALVDSSMNADFGQYNLTGFAANLVYQQINAYTLVAGQGSYTLTGFAVNLLDGYVLTAVKGQYNLTGQFNTLIWSGAPAVVSGGSRTMGISRLRIGL